MSRERIKILYLIGFLSDNGGAERFALGLATHLPRDRFEPWVCAPRGAEPLATAALADAGIPFIGLGRKANGMSTGSARCPGSSAVTASTCCTRTCSAPISGGRWWGAACRVPVVVAQEHTWSYEGAPWRVWLDGHVIGRFATRFVAVSNADAERMVTIENVPTRKVTVVPTAYVPQADGGTGHRPARRARAGARHAAVRVGVEHAPAEGARGPARRARQAARDYARQPTSRWQETATRAPTSSGASGSCRSATARTCSAFARMSTR